MSAAPFGGPPAGAVAVDAELDCRGLPCPAPVLALAKAARARGDAAPGTVLAVVAEDPAARVDVPAWCRMRGHDYLGADVAPDGVARHVVRLGGAV
ncbi:sulfurtransferase TusA family protein [Nocardioides zeae]